MTVLVAYATRHGATAGIAERIAAGLRSAGVFAEARSVNDVRDIVGYDAFVIGGAAYMFHWLKDAAGFVKRYRTTLAERPTWLFSSGPLGTELVDEEGHDVLETTRPREWRELAPMVRSRGERVFFGAWDPTQPPKGMAERLMRLMPAARDGLPSGDFRDWAAIDAWAAEVAAALAPVQAGAATESPAG
jgi:menaquinone-dependent protoporphyrinogen oxidase